MAEVTLPADDTQVCVCVMIRFSCNLQAFLSSHDGTMVESSLQRGCKWPFHILIKVAMSALFWPLVKKLGIFV